MVISAISFSVFDAKIYLNIGWIRNHLVMVDAGGISGNRTSDRKGEAGFEVTEKGNTARTIADLSGRQYNIFRLTTRFHALLRHSNRRYALRPL